jgi:ABC-2 type transport system permease protein
MKNKEVYEIALNYLDLSLVEQKATFSLFIIQDSIISMSRFPIEIFTNKFFRLFFTFVAPIAFISTFPARIFIHGFQWKLILGSLVLAGIFFWLSRKFWLFSLKHYCSAGG